MRNSLPCSCCSLKRRQALEGVADPDRQRPGSLGGQRAVRGEDPVLDRDARPADVEVHSSAELLEKFQGKAADAPMCMTCGTKMRPAGSCYVCEGCGSTSGCS